MGIRWVVIIAMFLSSAEVWSAPAGKTAMIEGEIGTLIIPGASSADHSKMGLHFSAIGLEGSSWSPWVQLDTAFSTLGIVNSGAAATESSPDLRETGGTVPLLLRVLVRTPLRIQSISLRVFTGFTWFVLDKDHAVTASVPFAPTLGFQSIKPLSRTWDLEAGLGISWNPFGYSAWVFNPEVALKKMLFSLIGLRLTLRSPIVHASAGPGVIFVQPSMSLGLLVRI